MGFTQIANIDSAVPSVIIRILFFFLVLAQRMLPLRSLQNGFEHEQLQRVWEETILQCVSITNSRFCRTDCHGVWWRELVVHWIVNVLIRTHCKISVDRRDFHPFNSTSLPPHCSCSPKSSWILLLVEGDLMNSFGVGGLQQEGEVGKNRPPLAHTEILWWIQAIHWIIVLKYACTWYIRMASEYEMVYILGAILIYPERHERKGGSLPMYMLSPSWSWWHVCKMCPR